MPYDIRVIQSADFDHAVLVQMSTSEDRVITSETLVYHPVGFALTCDTDKHPAYAALSQHT